MTVLMNVCTQKKQAMSPNSSDSFASGCHHKQYILLGNCHHMHQLTSIGSMERNFGTSFVVPIDPGFHNMEFL